VPPPIVGADSMFDIFPMNVKKSRSLHLALPFSIFSASLSDNPAAYLLQYRRSK